ncbi:hypothetical protein ABIC22_000277 [Paenibacillus sp. PvP094]
MDQHFPHKKVKKLFVPLTKMGRLIQSIEGCLASDHSK